VSRDAAGVLFCRVCYPQALEAQEVRMKSGRTMVIACVVFAVVSAASTAFGQIIPGDRRIDWTPGIPGGDHLRCRSLCR